MLALADWEEERMANHERRCREAVQSFMGDRRQPNVPLAERLLASRMGYEARRQLNQPFQITVIHRHTDSEGQHDTYYPLMVRPYTTLWQIKRMMSSLQNIEPQHIHFEIDGVSWIRLSQEPAIGLRRRPPTLNPWTSLISPEWSGRSSTTLLGAMRCTMRHHSSLAAFFD